jgi:hypothetical protein
MLLSSRDSPHFPEVNPCLFYKNLHLKWNQTSKIKSGKRVTDSIGFASTRMFRLNLQIHIQGQIIHFSNVRTDSTFSNVQQTYLIKQRHYQLKKPHISISNAHRNLISVAIHFPHSGIQWYDNCLRLPYSFSKWFSQKMRYWAKPY